MRRNKARLAFVLAAALFAWTATFAGAAGTPVEKRRVSHVPAEPAAGQAVLFTASHFRTPGLLKWDMGDGTVLTSGGQAAQGQDATVSYTYAAPGQYLVRVFDDKGDVNLPPVTTQVTVGAQVAAAAEAVKAMPPSPAKEMPVVVPATARKEYSLVKFGPLVGYFQPKDALIKQIYGNGDVLYGARSGIHVWQGFYFWLSASQLKVIGMTTVTGDKTTLTLLPVSVSVRYHAGRGFLIPYAGIGFTFLSFKEESELVGDTNGHGSNVLFEAGLEMRLNRYFSLDLGARFDQIKVQPKNSPAEVDLGGLQATVTFLVSF